MQNDASEMVVPALIVILIVYVIDMALFDLFLCCCTNVCHRQFETQGDARQRMVTVKYDLPVSYIRHNINGRFISRIGIIWYTFKLHPDFKSAESYSPNASSGST